MDQLNQGESSGVLSVHQTKRKRGRPRKDPSLMYAGAAPVPPGFDRVRESQPQMAYRTGGADNVVGQAVTGVVEGTFDAGYLLTVRIGNSPTNFRGVVFKPGHYVPVSAENDVAPHLQMIRRTDVSFPAGNRSWPRHQDPDIQAAVKVPKKRKRELPPISPGVLPRAPPVGVRGTVVPVVLQPVNFLNVSNPRPPNPSQPHPMDLGEKDVHSVEPLAVLPPDQSIPTNQIFVGTQSHTGLQKSHGSEQNDNKAFNEGTASAGKQANVKPMESTDAGNSSGNLGGVPKQETGNVNGQPTSTGFLQTGSVPKALFNFGTGRMTELLQAVQENLKENRAAEIAGEPPKAT